METTITLSIALHRVENLVAILVEESTGCLKVFLTLREVVVIDEVIAGVIRRVNIDHLDFTKIVLAENFQHIKIITLYVKIFCVPEIFRCFQIRAKSLVDSSIGKTRSGTLIGPSELIALFALFEYVL